MTDTSVTPDLVALNAAIESIDMEAAREDDPVLLAEMLAALRDAKQDLARVYTAVEQYLLANMGEKKLEVPGLGVVEAKGAPKRTAWRHDELIPVIVAKALDERQFDPETGEALEREAETVARVLRECISFGAGKVTGLRARGIQPDEWCIATDLHYSVVLPPRSEG